MSKIPDSEYKKFVKHNIIFFPGMYPNSEIKDFKKRKLKLISLYVVR